MANIVRWIKLSECTSTLAKNTEGTSFKGRSQASGVGLSCTRRLQKPSFCRTQIKICTSCGLSSLCSYRPSILPTKASKATKGTEMDGNTQGFCILNKCLLYIMDKPLDPKTMKNEGFQFNPPNMGYNP